MRRLILVSLLLTAACALAQDTQPAKVPSSDAARQSATQPGHPLDPYDVYVLTGKKDEAERRQQTTPSMQMYYGVPSGDSQFSGAGSSRWDSSGTQMFDTSGFSGENNFNGFNAGIPFGSQFSGSQFADVTTLSRPGFGFLDRRRAGFRPRWFFGNGTPAFNFRPRGFGGGFQGFTAPGFSPGPRP